MAKNPGQESKVMKGLPDGTEVFRCRANLGAIKMPTKTSYAKIWGESPINIQGCISALEE